MTPRALLISAIEDNDPVIFLEPKRIYNGPFNGHHDQPVVPWTKHPAAEVPEGYYTVPLGKAAIVRPGEQMTVLAYGTMVHVALTAAEEAGIDAEIIDLRTLLPVDIEAIVTSVEKTGRCVIVHEATRTSGYGAELSALVQEHCFYHLEAPIERVTGWDTPYPHAFEWEYFPGPERVAAAHAPRVGGLIMGIFVFKLPDVGEGTAEAEIVAWHVKLGDVVEEDQNLVDVMTDKATVEMTAPVSGKVIALHGEPGAMAPVGAPLVEFEVEGAGNVKPGAAKPAPKAEAPKAGSAEAGAQAQPSRRRTPATPMPLPQEPPRKVASAPAFTTRIAGEKPLASPAVRQRARDLGIELQFVPGTGPAGRISHADLDSFVASGGHAQPLLKGPVARDGVEDVKVIGLRRKIAEKMQQSKRRIPHYAYVDEIDMTELESLRAHLNATKTPDQPKLTVLPFFMRALVKVLPDYPQINARFDDEAGIVHRHAAIHIGIATQTANGLIVPVVRHAEALDVWQSAAEVARVSTAARENKAKSDELQGSTITITSLGPLGGLVTTPVINHPEVAIIGPNKIIERPVVTDGGQITVAQDDEPVVQLRPSRGRWLRCRRVHPEDQGAAGASGDVVHGLSDGLGLRKVLNPVMAGLVPATHEHEWRQCSWLPGTGPGMTRWNSLMRRMD